MAEDADAVPPSMPEWFRKHGYNTVSVGKVSHHPGGLGGEFWDDPDVMEMPHAWDRHLMPAGAWKNPLGVMHGLAHGNIRGKSKAAAKQHDVFESAEGPDSIYPDGLIATEGLKQIETLMLKEDRARFQIQRLKLKYPELDSKILSKGEELLLEPIGNHNRGTEFLDGSDKINEQLVKVFDEVASTMDGFYYGRFDVKVKDWESLYQGKIKIENEVYFIKQNELGETIGFSSKGQKVDILSLLPESVVALNFEDGKLITEFNYESKKPKLNYDVKNEVRLETEEVSFINIYKVPTFPGCETGDKKCFSKMVQKHFSRNFNADLPKTLGLSKGKKRVFIGFKIDKHGAIVDVKVKAPHEDIKNEVLTVMNSMPKMIPGELESGKKVAVKYNIPFTILVE